MKPRILFIMQLPPPVHGASIMNKAITESMVINSKFNCDYVNLTTASDVNNIGKAGFMKYIKSVKIYFKVLRKIIWKKYNLIYLTLSPHGIAFYKDAILALVLKFLGFKLVYHLHGKGIKAEYEKSRIKLRLYKRVFKNVDVIHLSELLYFDIENIINKKHVWYVPNGVKLDPKFKIEDKISTNKILYLSNMQESKGSYTLLQAAKNMKAKGVDFHIDFVGKWHNDVRYKEKWERFYYENKLEDVVTYHGAKYGQEKNIFFAEAGIFILPTSNDCFPISILEAMSYGNSVISTNEGAIPEILLNHVNGYIVKKSNSKELSLRISEILESDKIKKEFGKNSYERVKELYTLEIFEKNLYRTMKLILKGN